MLRVLLLLALSASGAAADPLLITGRVVHPPKDVHVELRPWAVEHSEALKRLKGEAVPPLASTKPRADGSFELQVPDGGFYSVVARAEGRVAMERFVRFVVEETEVPPVELAAASPLEVRAVGADGRPLAGVTIQALPLKAESGPWRAAERRAVTDAEGRAVFLRAEGEALALFVTTPGSYATASTSPAGASETVRFAPLRTRTVEFRGPDGKPAAGALVRLARREWPYGLAGEDGRIPLPVPLEGEMGLFAEDARGRRIQVVIGTGQEKDKETPVLTLVSPTTVSGRVLDASSREPVAGALVWNGSSGGMSWTRTGAGGAFEVRAPSGDRGWIEATAAGRMVHVEGWTRERNAALTFLLEAAAPISGQVVDGEGRPVAGARVTTIPNPGEGGMIHREERSSESGPDGRFSLPRLPAGRLHALEASREGFAPARQLADSTAPVRLVLRRGALAFGRIVDEEDVPVPGARASLAAEPDAIAHVVYRPFEATADSEGRFRLSGVSAGRFTFRAESPGFVATVLENVLIPEQETAVDLGEIRLPSGGAIEGIVTDTRGRPVAEAWVVPSPSDSEDFRRGMAVLSGRRPTQTGPDGRFRIGDLPRGARYDLDVDHEDLLPADVLGVEVPTAEPLRIRLGQPRTLSGRVVDERGEPITGASVQASVTIVAPDRSSHSRGHEGTRTDPEGRFVLSRVSPGKIDLLASASGYRSRSLPVQVPEEGEADVVEIVLGPGTSLEGRVLDSQGLPVHRAQVETRCRYREGESGHSVSTDEEGRYEVLDLEPGACEVQALLHRHSRSTRAAVEIRPGRNRFDLRFAAGAEISGRVFDSRGEPLPGASLSLERSRQGEAQWPTWPLQAVSSADGSFAFADVADGEYQLNASRRGFGLAAYPHEIRVDGAPVAGLELRLSPGAVIRGRILGLPPEETRSVSVHAWLEGQGRPLRATLSPEAAYRIDDVAPGKWHVIANVAPDLTIQETAEVAEGAGEVVLDLELPAGFTLTGRVLVDREPLAGASVRAFDRAIGVQRHGGTGQDGAFRLERLPAGSYLLLVEVPPGAGDYRTLEIGGDLDVTVEISTGAVAGRVLRPEGLPVPGAALVLAREIPGVPETAPGAIGQSDERGAFEILRVPAGTYRLFVLAEGLPPSESRIVVTPGGTVNLDVALRVSP